jgi:hypothetical protein
MKRFLEIILAIHCVVSSSFNLVHQIWMNITWSICSCIDCCLLNLQYLNDNICSSTIALILIYYINLLGNKGQDSEFNTEFVWSRQAQSVPDDTSYWAVQRLASVKFSCKRNSFSPDAAILYVATPVTVILHASNTFCYSAASSQVFTLFLLFISHFRMVRAVFSESLENWWLLYNEKHYIV